jgi:eukaryotic-like serine/threonine-protein kinase
VAHLDDTTLALYVERQLSDHQLDELRNHIDSCGSCRELLVELAKSNKVLAEGSTHGPPAPPVRQLLHPGDRVGRYLVQDLVGSGAMGAVYAALDTELDRKVAIKLVHRSAAAFAARMRREAQALARVADRGVVAVHDVGTYNDKIYIAMELVTGGTFKTWLLQAPRTLPEILAVTLAVARGLAAAHEVGLVHRDVKADNILVDDHGVARIGDFGLAADVGERWAEGSGADPVSTELTASGTLLGTPAYMSPEQLAGHAATQRSDQFSFCVTVYEAVFGRRPYTGTTIDEIRRAMDAPLVMPPRAPAPVRKALARGLSIDPEHRFPSMRALTRALDLAPRRRRLYIAAAATAGLVAITASVAIARSTVETRANPCLDGERKLTGIWDTARKAELERTFLVTGAPFAADAWRGFSGALDRYAASWTAMHRSTCEATRVHGDQTEYVLDLRMWCLDDRLHDARVLTDSLRTATSASVSRAVTAADRLPTVDICADARALAQKLPPRDAAARANIDRVHGELAQVKTLWNLGQLEASHALVLEVSKAVATLDYPPLEAEIMLEQARITFIVDSDAKATEQLIERALWAADRGRDDYLRARAWNLLYFIVGAESQRFDEAAKIYEHASAALQRLEGAETLEAQLLGNHGQMLTLAGKFKEAATTLERSLALLEKTVGPDHIETGNALAALSDVYARLGDTERSLAFAQRAYDVHVRTLGKRHPETAKSLFSIAMALEDTAKYDEAAAKLEDVISTLEAALGKDHIDLGNALDELGIVRRKQHRLDDALALHRRALAIRESKLGDHTETAVSLDNVGIVLGMLGRHAEALPYHQRALAITEQVMGPDHVETATSRSYLANAYLGLGRTAEALAMFRAALVVTEKALGPEAADLGFFLAGIGQAQLDLKHPADAIAPFERALRLRGAEGDPMSTAEIQFGLARALWATKRDRTRARELAESALPHYKAANDPAVERWLAAPR